MIIQLGITLVTPVLLSVAFCWWICDTFGIGVWIYIPGILFGLGASVMSGYKFYQSVMRMQKRRKKEKKNPVSFNDHV